MMSERTHHPVSAPHSQGIETQQPAEALATARDPRDWLLVLVIAAAYVITGKLGFTLAFVVEQVTAVWPPTGISLAALLLLGLRVWPGVALGAFFVNVFTDVPPAGALGIATGNTLEAVIGWYLLRRSGFGNGLERLSDVFKLLAIGAVLSAIVSATVGTASLCFSGLTNWSAYAHTWLTWWVGDGIAALVVTPLILAWATAPRRSFQTRTLAEAAVLLSAVTLAAVVVFYGEFGEAVSRNPFIIFPFLIWAPIRFGQQGATTLSLLVSGIAITATVQGSGPFVVASAHESLLLLQAFMGVQAVTAMVLAAVLLERKHAEAMLSNLARELQRSNRELEEFARIASHDLQEPLRKIQAFGDRLVTMLGAGLSEHGRDYLARMQAAAKRMSTLINDLLTYSRVTTKAQPFVQVDLGRIAREVLSDLETRIEETGGRVALGDLPMIEADPLQMRQLLQNLIGNALKFHRKDIPPVVTVAGEPGGYAQTVQLSITDNGIGFDMKYLDRIFDVFQRLHGRTEYDGTGLGLAVCRKLVERHGGTITATSAPEQGATFIVTLPIKQGATS
jgi:signal transduction histidine kinase